MIETRETIRGERAHYSCINCGMGYIITSLTEDHLNFNTEMRVMTLCERCNNTIDLTLNLRVTSIAPQVVRQEFNPPIEKVFLEDDLPFAPSTGKFIAYGTSGMQTGADPIAYNNADYNARNPSDTTVWEAMRWADDETSIKKAYQAMDKAMQEDKKDVTNDSKPTPREDDDTDINNLF